MCVLIDVLMVYIMMSDDGLDVDWILDSTLDYMDWKGYYIHWIGYICICGWIPSPRNFRTILKFGKKKKNFGNDVNKRRY